MYRRQILASYNTEINMSIISHSFVNSVARETYISTKKSNMTLFRNALVGYPKNIFNGLAKFKMRSNETIFRVQNFWSLYKQEITYYEFPHNTLKKYECFRYISGNRMNNYHNFDVYFVHIYLFSEPQIRIRNQKLYKIAVLFLLKYVRFDHKF